MAASQANSAKATRPFERIFLSELALFSAQTLRCPHERTLVGRVCRLRICDGSNPVCLVNDGRNARHSRRFRGRGHPGQRRPWPRVTAVIWAGAVVVIITDGLEAEDITFVIELVFALLKGPPQWALSFKLNLRYPLVIEGTSQAHQCWGTTERCSITAYGKFTGPAKKGRVGYRSRFGIQ